MFVSVIGVSVFLWSLSERFFVGRAVLKVSLRNDNENTWLPGPLQNLEFHCSEVPENTQGGIGLHI